LRLWQKSGTGELLEGICGYANVYGEHIDNEKKSEISDSLPLQVILTPLQVMVIPLQVREQVSGRIFSR
jgi:hypothetical protein